MHMIEYELVEYHEHNENEVSNVGILNRIERIEITFSGEPVLQMAVLFCPLPGIVHHLVWWLTKSLVNHIDSFIMYMEMGNNNHTEMQLRFQDSPDPAVFMTAPQVGGTGLKLTATNHTAITQKFWLLN